MNGARSLLTALVNEGVDVCFSNPGTSEMHFVAALDDVPDMRGILALFEGVATGAADGYGRVTGRPASVLLHLGPGLGNGLANLHNARRARTPLLAVVGDHALSHGRFDAPLASDITSIATTCSVAVTTSMTSNDVAADAVDAVRAAQGTPSGVSTLILPADVSWGECSEGGPSRPRTQSSARTPASDATVSAIANKMRAAAKPVVLVGGRAAQGAALTAAARCAEAVKATLMVETFPAITDRGAGTPQVTRLSYFGEFATAQLEGVDLLVLVDAASPAAFFAYPGASSDLVPPGTEVISLTDGGDHQGSLERLADALGAAPLPQAINPLAIAERPTGVLNASSLAAAVAATLPEGTIVVDESNTGGIHLAGATAGAPPHQWMTLTGGAIGYGLPAAVGAAVGRPESRVLCLESDGSAMYTFQALWTMAREELDVTVVILSNRSYAILNLELARVGAVADGSRAAAMLELTRPEIGFVSLSHAMGVPALRATTAEELTAALEASYAQAGPMLIEAVLPPGLG
ncbi:MAG: acetolactate synthase large subunit [Actinomycetes bacterium]